jgi:hypothetical protein
MNRFIRVLLLAMGLVVALLTTTPGLAQPPIPHPLEGRERCTVCHETGVGGAPRFPADHAGRTDDTCTQCHVPAGRLPTPGPGVSLPTPVPGGPPNIPHSLVGREHCLACHAKGVGGAPIPPPDHQGRDNDTCQGCHVPAPEGATAPTPAPTGPVATPVPLPTAIVHPAGGATNSCFDCHVSLGGQQTEVANQWKDSVHAKAGIGCADCHGGDPRTNDLNLAMAPAAGYIGVPAKTVIPEICGACHSDVDRMRQYDLPTDQFAKYQESVHGRLLREKGDLNVATCADCHGSHAIKETNDPGADVYPTNVPALCARCHANAELMRPYGIPTNQYALYKDSVHGEALLQRQDLRAPSCATCHGTHGAAPPGFAEVANVCGGCHTATQDYYLQSTHAKLGDAGPKCVTCHGRYDVMKPDETLFVGPQDRHCGSCHSTGTTIAAQVSAIQAALVDAALAYNQAEESMNRAASQGMIVAAEESKLAQANTSLITARAAQHTTQLPTVTKLTDQAKADSQAARESAEKKIAEGLFRRQAMVVVIAGIALTIGALFNVKRELDRQLERRRKT